MGANADYWRAKIARNRARDLRTLAEIENMGWRTLVIHECERKDAAALEARLAEALRSVSKGSNQTLGA